MTIRLALASSWKIASRMPGTSAIVAMSNSLFSGNWLWGNLALWRENVEVDTPRSSGTSHILVDDTSTLVIIGCRYRLDYIDQEFNIGNIARYRLYRHRLYPWKDMSM